MQEEVKSKANIISIANFDFTRCFIFMKLWHFT
jgi:hypothetical protein